MMGFPYFVSSLFFFIGRNCRQSNVITTLTKNPKTTLLVSDFDPKQKSIILDETTTTTRSRSRRITTILNLSTRNINNVATSSAAAAAITSNDYDDLVEWIKSIPESYVGPVEIRPSSVGDDDHHTTTNDYTGYGCFAIRDIEDDELLFVVPKEACLSFSTVVFDADVGDDLMKNIVDKAGGPGGVLVGMAGWMAKEKMLLDAADAASIEYDIDDDADDDRDESGTGIRRRPFFFEPYFRTLPWSRDDQEHILFWSEDDVKELFKDSIAEDDAIGLISEVSLAKKVLRPIIIPAVRRKLAKKNNDDDENDNNNSFRWPWDKKATPATTTDDYDEATTTRLDHDFDNAINGAFVSLLSRSFQYTNDDHDESLSSSSHSTTTTTTRLVPLLDMLQHANEPTIRHEANPATGHVEVRARGDITAGDEIYNRYQTLDVMPASVFFTHFGFIPNGDGAKGDAGRVLLERKHSIFFPEV